MYIFYVNKNGILVIIYILHSKAIDTEIKFSISFGVCFYFPYIFELLIYLGPEWIGARRSDSLLESLIHGMDFLLFPELYEHLG